MIRPLILAALVASSAYAERPADYAFGVPLTPGDGAAFQRVVVPAVAYEGAVRRDLADLRIFNGDGELVPYAFIPRRPAPRERPPAIGLQMFPLYVDRDRRDVSGLSLTVVRNAAGTTVSVNAADGDPATGKVLGGYVLDASAQDQPLVALTFALPEISGATTMRLRIDASDDLAAWRGIAADATLVDLQYGGQRLTRNRIEFAPTKAKYLRLSWAADRPVIEFSAVNGEYGERAIEAPREWRNAAGIRVAEREGEYEYDLGGAFPVDRIAFDFATPNSIVPASLSARSAPAEPWQLVGSTVFYRLEQPGGDATSPPFPVAGGERRYWLLRVDPRSGAAGQTPPPLRAGWQPQEIVFVARGRAPFTLAYGNQAATAGALPIATLVPGYDSANNLPANFAVARVGEPTSLGGQDRLRKPPDVRRWVLWAALVLGVVVLGWMAWRLSRELASATPASKANPPEPRSE
jgi:Protein of unknown function (DUF3999)